MEPEGETGTCYAGARYQDVESWIWGGHGDISSLWIMEIWKAENADCLNDRRSAFGINLVT